MTAKGFIDLHTHGLGRYDTRTSNWEHIVKIAELHGKAGTGAILPTIYPASIEEMRKNIEAVRQAMQVQKSEVSLLRRLVRTQADSPRRAEARSQKPKALLHYRTFALILGVHIEGPFLNPLRCGALDKNTLIRPSLSSLRKLIDGYEDIIKIITVAPEIPGALKVIEECREIGMKVNMGHSDATYEQALDGKKAGATGITHIFNAMRPFHHREPGLAGLGLLDEDLYIELIADGIHLHTRTLELIFSKKRLDKIMLVSDSVRGAKEKDKSVYRKGILAESSVALSASVKVLRKIGLPGGEIIEAAVDNPRRYLLM